MPDITMCRNETCSLKEYCYRYTAKPSGWQSYSYFNTEISQDRGVYCEYFLDNKKEKVKENE